MVSNESIYELIPRVQVPEQKPPMYHSKFPGKVDPHGFELGARTTKPLATMGKPLGASADHPQDFIKAHSKEPKLPTPGAPTRPKEKIKSPVPKRTEVPVMGLVSKKNFVTANAVENILAKARKPAEPEPLYTQRPGFGQVPVYLRKNQAKIAAERAQVEAYIRLRDEQAHHDSSDARVMSEDERQDLLRHLKLKWSSLNSAYQKLSFTLDTPTKRVRKEGCESQLAEIEKDIRTLERGDLVMVRDDL